ncbi:lipid-A-disaccharide synthase [Mesorhizobium sp. BR1-1-16]|uniref:lipid-A-disaccharide synthase n=1 Tax=Mesorhizobium sp. BR1-1-16 TaxID=2876653 RepID=UPI001CCDE1A6|nr:lipid-A-disaccharide synthase [Mesorhizobium sp. BR1-1-16]MBZ9935300.1 lipid-A-disaccharide synthase [Mesorhizobium sp. BR1-1-16]
MSLPATRPLRVFILAGEESGDALAGPLMGALAERVPGGVMFRGVGGSRMAAAGLHSLFPMDDLTAIGIGEVVGKLPRLIGRLRGTVAAILADPPDVLLLVDAPDFTHRVAARVRRRLPFLPIVKYVAPTVWAWRPGRARAMRGVIDHVLALFPFEPAVMARLGGPPTTYVGHPLLGELARLRPGPDDELRRASEPPLLLVLPGSRKREVAALAPIFGETLGRLRSLGQRAEVVLPTLPRLEATLRAATAAWPIPPDIVVGEAARQAAFRAARGALAASGTVTLELALAGVPTVGAYRVPAWEAFIARRVLTTPTVILPNIILGEVAVPELLQEDCAPGPLADALLPLLADGPARADQLARFARLDALMSTHGVPAEGVAAETVLSAIAEKARSG